MKTLFFTIISFYLGNCLFAQKNFPSEYKKHLAVLHNQINSSEVNNDITDFTSDFWAPTEMTSQMWLDDDWRNTAYTQFFYDDGGLLTNDLSMGWQNDTWINNVRTTYTYENNLQSVAESENWENETWVPTAKSQWTYSGDGNVTNIVDQFMENGEWVNFMQTTYTYSGKNCIEMLMQNWENGEWVTQNKTTFEYDAEGNNTINYNEFWYSGILMNSSKEVNTFENGLRVQTLRQNLVGTDWMDASRATYTYNVTGQQTQFISEEWTGTDWLYTMKGQDSYDENGNNTEILTQSWSNDTWENFMKVTFVYQQMTDVEENVTTLKDYKLFNNFPNPFNPSTNFRFRIPDKSNVKIVIFDLLGKEVETILNDELSAGEYSISWTAENLSGGVYYCRLVIESYYETIKILFLK